MLQNTHTFGFHRGECIDLHIAALREKAENTYGQIFADAVKLRSKIADDTMPDAEYDAAVRGLICSTILGDRPLPSPVRSCLGKLLGLEIENRARLVNVSPSSQRPKERRSDETYFDLLVKALQVGLYPPDSYMANLTDIQSGLEGLHLTLRKDITAEADSSGVISVEAVQRIRSKLAQTVCEEDRHRELVDIVERAASIGSSLVCIPSLVREERITVLPRKRFRVVEAPADHPIYSTGYVIGALASTIRIARKDGKPSPKRERQL